MRHTSSTTEPLRSWGCDMSRLPPDGEWIVQMIGSDVVVFHHHTEEEIARWPAADANAAAKAQKVIHDTPLLDAEQKSMAHFWSGYFYAYAAQFERLGGS